MNIARPLLVSGDPELIDDCSRLAVVTGAELHVLSQSRVDRMHWTQAPLVLVGIDCADGIEALPRRSGVIVVMRGSGESVDPQAWKFAVAIGAEQVACLPDARSWLIERLGAGAEEPPRAGHLLAVMPATGGAGASTLAAACAAHASTPAAPAALIDGDRLGGGIDIVLGGEETPGVRWPELADTRGRLAPASLRQALPIMCGTSVLSWDREGSPEPTAEAWRAVLDSAVRGFDLTVIDLPRTEGELAVSILGRADALVLVVSARVRAVIAAVRRLEELAPVVPDIRIVVRERQGGVRVDTIARTLGVPVLGSIPAQTSVSDDGRLPRIPAAVLDACIALGRDSHSSRLVA